MAAIEINGVTKSFKRHVHKRFLTLKSTMIRDLWRRERKGEDLFWALKGVDAVVAKGTTVGLIGANGSGKSTLLKLIAGILKPTAGTVKVNGRISALIELGAGFHPEISGRENIFINGIMLGLTKRQINERFNDIVAFSELEEFIDNPVKSYSSGMYMRLGFSVAIHVDPEILLIDEVLAVGDQAFVHKCIDRIFDFKRKKKTIVMVTHNLGAVEKLCDHAIWLEQGLALGTGQPRRVIESYIMHVTRREEERYCSDNQAIQAAIDEIAQAEQVQTGEAATTDSNSQQEETQPADGVASTPSEPRPDAKSRWGSREVEIYQVKMYDLQMNERYVFQNGEGAIVKLWYQAKKCVEAPVFGFGIFTSNGAAIYGTNTDLEMIPLEKVEGKGVVTLTISRLDLVEGTYLLDVAVHAEDGRPYDYHCHLYNFAVRSLISDVGYYRPPHAWEFEPELRNRKQEQET